MRPGHAAAGRLEWGAMGALVAFTLASVLGFATFGMNPALLARVPQVAGLYEPAFRFFAVGQVWLAFGVFALVLSLRAGPRWIAAFGACYLISLTSELLGTRFGVPFGHYQYSTLLSPMWLGLVPVVIPLSWFYMAVPSWAMAVWALRGRPGVTARIALASFLLLAWDLILDPAMSYATRYWSWESTGPYYGMPWLNLFGWYVTGLALMGALAVLRAEQWLVRVDLRWLVAFYGVNLLLPLGMAVAAGLQLAVACTAVVLGLTGWGMARLRGLPVIGVVGISPAVRGGQG